jgi:hypothetical protein
VAPGWLLAAMAIGWLTVATQAAGDDGSARQTRGANAPRNAALVRPVLGRGLTPAARFALHEALHFAALPENPPDPSAMTAAEIQRMVEQSCTP